MFAAGPMLAAGTVDVDLFPAGVVDPASLQDHRLHTGRRVYIDRKYFYVSVPAAWLVSSE